MDDCSDFQNSPISKFFKYIYIITFGSIYFVLCNFLLIIAIYLLKIEIENILGFFIALIPTGPSLAALISIISKVSSDEEIHITKEFFKEYIKNFKAALKVWITLLTLGTILILDLDICFRYSNFPLLILPIILIFIFIILLVLNSFPILCRYEIDTWNNFKLSIHFIFKKPLTSIANLLILIVCIYFLKFNNIFIQLLIPGIAIFAIMNVYQKIYFIIDNEYLNNILNLNLEK